MKKRSSEPLFIALKKEHYDRFERGDKDTEYRAYGARWNEGTCWRGRKVILSCGYGKSRRMTAIIEYAEIQRPTDIFLEIYGKDRACFAIKLVNLKKVKK